MFAAGGGLYDAAAYEIDVWNRQAAQQPSRRDSEKSIRGSTRRPQRKIQVSFDSASWT